MAKATVSSKIKRRKPAIIKNQPQKPKGPSMVERAKKFLDRAINYAPAIPALWANIVSSQVGFIISGNVGSVIGCAFFIDASAKKGIGWGKRSVIMLSALLFFGYNIYNALSNTSHFSAEHVDARRGEIDKKRQTEGLLKSVDAQIAALQAQRKPLTEKAGEDTPETIRKAIDGKHYDVLWRRTRECTNATADESRKFCDSITKLEGAIPAAEARGKIDDKLGPLQTQESNLSTKLAEMAPPAAADELGQAVGNIAGIAGYEVSEKGASSARTVKDLWWALMAEVLAAMGPMVVGLLRGTHETAQPVRANSPKGKAQEKPTIRQSEKDAPTAPTLPQEDRADVGANVGANVGNDPVKEFFDAELTSDTGHNLKSSVAYDMFVVWCEERGIDAGSNRAFTISMKRFVGHSRNGNYPHFLNVRARTSNVVMLRQG